MWELVGFAVVLSVMPLIAGGYFGLRTLRRAVSRVGAAPRGRREGPVRTVRGRIATLHAVTSPIDGLPCAIAWTVIEGHTRFGLPARVEIGTAATFLLESAEGTFQVLPVDLWVRRHRIEPQFLLTKSLPPQIAERVASSRIESLRPLRYAEGYFAPGDEIELRGVCRPEPCLDLQGPRGPRVLPTLSGGGGRLEIRTPIGLVAASQP